jgi:hypothetical protein
MNRCRAEELEGNARAALWPKLIAEVLDSADFRPGSRE